MAFAQSESIQPEYASLRALSLGVLSFSLHSREKRSTNQACTDITVPSLATKYLTILLAALNLQPPAPSRPSTTLGRIGQFNRGSVQLFRQRFQPAHASRVTLSATETTKTNPPYVDAVVEEILRCAETLLGSFASHYAA